MEGRITRNNFGIIEGRQVQNEIENYQDMIRKIEQMEVPKTMGTNTKHFKKQ